MDDLVAFLKARLDEAEVTVSHSGPAQVAWLTLRDGEGRMLYSTVAAGGEGDWDPWVAYGKEIAEHAEPVRVVYDPVRARREIAADRKLFDLYERAKSYRDKVFAGPEPRSISDEMRAVTQMVALEQVLKLRATVYSDHPDYQPGWSPHDQAAPLQNT